MNRWDAAETAAHIVLALEGNALQVLMDVAPEELSDYSSLTLALKRRFGKRTSTDQLRDQLAHRRRADGEALGAYAADVRYYTEQGYPTFDPSACDELALSAFIRGLTPEKLREHLRLRSPTTLQVALEEAERVETVLSPRQQLRPQVRQAEISDDDEEGAVCQAQPSPAPAGLRQPRRRLQARQNPGDCYRCGEPGHMARDCPAPALRRHAPDHSGN